MQSSNFRQTSGFSPRVWLSAVLGSALLSVLVIAGMVSATDAGIVLSPTSVAIDEDDKQNYTVALQTAPTADVTVTITSDNPDADVNNATLTFKPDDWDTAQTVQVEAKKDDDTADDSATLTHTATSDDTNYNNLTATMTVTITDINDAGLKISKDELQVKEADASTKSYTVELEAAPTADVTVAITSDNTDVTVDETSLTFTEDDWETKQTVVVTAAADADTADENATLTHTVTSDDANFQALAAQTLAVTVVDTTPALRLSATSVAIDEGGAKQKYRVALQTAPTHDVNVAITSSNADVTVDTALLMFKIHNWDTAQPVEVTAGSDFDTADESATLTHAATSDDTNYGGLTATVTVTVTDDDEAGLTISSSTDGLTVTEADATGTSYTVELDAAPTADVTVAITSDNDAVTVDKTSLTFTATADNWKTKQMVVVTAGEDDDNRDENATLTHTVSSADAKFQALAPETVAVTVLDNDAALRFGTTSVAVDEGDTGQTVTAKYTVELQLAPTADVTVAIASDNTDVTVDETSVTFTAANWSRAHVVELTVVHDDDNRDERARLTHTVSSDDPSYNNLAAAVVTVNITDYEPRVRFDPTSLTVKEGESGQLTLTLDTRADSSMTVTISSNNSDVTVDPASVTFPVTENGVQTNSAVVTVSAASDADSSNERATLTFAIGLVADKTVYDPENIEASTLRLKVRDDDGTSPPVTTKTPSQPTTTKVVTVAPAIVGGTGAATATEVDGRLVITRHDGGPSLVIDMGGFIRDETLGATYQVVRRADGMIVRRWVSPDSPLVYQIPWPIVNTQFTVPVGVVAAIPLDDQNPEPNMLTRRFDGGDDRIFSYDAGAGQWRHVPDVPTFQALSYYWCNVTAADAGYFNRVSIGSPHAATDMPARSDYPNCLTS